MGRDTDKSGKRSVAKGHLPSRRQLLKGAAAVAGAAAWTAPVIVDSLASPAAASSNCTGTSAIGMKLVIFAADDIE